MSIANGDFSFFSTACSISALTVFSLVQDTIYIVISLSFIYLEKILFR